MRPTISTGTGDRGKTDLIGGGRVSKGADRMQAIGSIDELNAIVGLLLAENTVPTVLKDQLSQLQHMLFVLGADLAAPPIEPSTCIARKDVELIEQWCVSFEQELPLLSRFILPNGSRASCLLHQARAVCRRAERWIVALSEKEEVREPVRLFINRVSDYLFLAARIANKEVGAIETEWQS